MRNNGSDTERRSGINDGSTTATATIDGGSADVGTSQSALGHDEPAQAASRNQSIGREFFKPVNDCPDGFCPMPTKEPEDKVNHPSHYTNGAIECIEAIEAQLSPEEFRGYLHGTLAVYLWRWKHKGGLEDLEKAEWYLKRLQAYAS
jgi:hypothetical protein